MELATQLIEALLEVVGGKIQPALQSEQVVIIRRRRLEGITSRAEQRSFDRLAALPAIARRGHAENDVPQPQLFLACGLSNSNPEWISESFQSSVMPSR